MTDDALLRQAELSDDELYLEIDRTVFGESAALLPAQLREAITRGRRLFEEWLAVHREEFCADPSVQRLLSARGSGAMSDLGVIVDVVTAISGGLPVGSLAVLIVRRGLNVICPVE